MLTTPDHPLSDELRAALAADDELGAEYSAAVRTAFLARLDAQIDARIDERRVGPDRLTVTRATVTAAVALGSIGLGVVFALVARDLGGLGGTVATLVAWGAILAINVIHARASAG